MDLFPFEFQRGGWMLDRVKTTLTGYAGYRGEGHYAFLLHRITGLGTLLFLLIHILDTATVYFAPALYAEAIALYRNPLFMLGEIALVFCLIFHGVNGLRIAVGDLFNLDWWDSGGARRAVMITLIISIVLWLPLAGIMGYNLARYGFGLFGGAG
jgi:succinate dehydrogenase / fumarate reductase, cytochrome b subunit